MRFCQCEYCEQRRKREPNEPDVAWLLSVGVIVLALAVGGVCVAFLVQPRCVKVILDIERQINGGQVLSRPK